MRRPADAERQSRHLQQVLQEVSESFVSGFERQIELLDRFYDDIVTSGADADASEAHRIVHRICGIARTLGFSKIGDAAADLEEATAENAWGSKQFDRDRILSGLEEIISEMEAARSLETDPDEGMASC